MMKIIITHQSNSISFEIEKNLPEHEAFEVLRAFSVSAFENLPEPLVYSLAGVAEPFLLQGPKDWKEGLQKYFRGSVVVLSIVEPKTESDSESDSYVVLTSGGDEKENQEEVATATQVAKPDEPSQPVEDIQSNAAAVEEVVEEEEEVEAAVIEDYDSEAELEDKQTDEEAEEPRELPMKQRIMQFIVEIGSEGLQNIAAVVHSLVTEGNADLGDAIRTAVETSEKAANHPLTKDLLALLDVYVQKFQHQFNWHALLSQFNIDHIVALIPGIVDALTRSLEGASDVELDLSPIMRQCCPLLAGFASRCIPNGQERVFHANPLNPLSVFAQAQQSLAEEFPQHQQQEDNRPVHRGIVCDGCEATPIVGVRYKSVLRSNFDLCEECEKDHDPKDPLIKIKTPVEDMDSLPGLREFRNAMGGGRGNRCHRRGGRGRGRGCRMIRRMFQQMQRPSSQPQDQQRGRCGSFANHPLFAAFANQFGCNQQQAPPENRRDPAHSAQEEPEMVAKKEEMKKKKAEVREAKAKVKALKKEAKACRKEMKKLRKEQKKKKKLDGEVVGHFDTDEKSVQKPGAPIIKTWKVINTGTESWGDDIIAVFVSGNKSLVQPGFEVINVDNVNPGGAAYIHCMLQAPEVEGTYSLTYRLANGNTKFGSRMTTEIEVVAENAPALNESTSTIETAITFSSEPGNNIPKEIVVEEEQDLGEEEVYSAADANVVASTSPSVPKPSVPKALTQKKEKAFEYAKQLTQLKELGFDVDEETMESVLVATKGDLNQAITLLM